LKEFANHIHLVKMIIKYIAAPQIGVHRRWRRVPDSKM